MAIIRSDVLILGAGPAGTTAAIHLAGKGYRVTLIDQHNFPRDKICGDALSGNTTYEVSKLPEQAQAPFHHLPTTLPAGGIRFVAPNGIPLDLPLAVARPGFSSAGFVVSRWDFDFYLWQQAISQPEVEFIQAKAESISISDQEVSVSSGSNVYIASFLLAGDGDKSMIRRTLWPNPIHRRHHSAGLRQYWTGVQGFPEGSFIELHFLPELLPGYFWIFPMTGDRANVGLGVRSDVVSLQKMDLKKHLRTLVGEHPAIAPRFSQATPSETIRGAGLPLGSTWRALIHHRVLMMGDAAGLVDPFSGEGIGQAMTSGRIAAETVLQGLKSGQGSVQSLQAYPQRLKRTLGSELRVSTYLQWMLRYPGLFNLVARKAQNRPWLRDEICDMLHHPAQRKRLLFPGFWWKWVR
jgi:geranylgeranyl reductase family protein